MSDGGKIGNKKPIIQSAGGNKHMQMKNERKLRKWEVIHVSAIGTKVGAKGNSVSIPNCS